MVGIVNNWDDLKLILAVSRYGTMSAAARALGLSTATVSRRLDRCAEELGQTLFVRRGHVWEPTSTARVFVELAEAVTEGFPYENQPNIPDELEKRVIRASMPLEVCLDSLAPKIPGFLEENPRLTLDLYHEEKSIAYGEIDLRLGYEEPQEGRLVRMRLGALGYRAYVSKSLTEEPKGWVEILGFDRKASPISNLTIDQFGPPRLRTTSINCAADLVKILPLLVYLPTKYAERNPQLVPWQPEVPTQYFPIWGSYHESRRLDPDVRLSLAFIKTCFEC